MAQVLSIDDETAAQRLDRWRTIVSSTFVSLDCTNAGDEAFRGAITTTGGGPLSLSLVDTVGQSVNRTRRLIRQDDAEVVLISCQLEGACILTQEDRAVRLGPGDFALYDSTRPYTLQFDQAFRQLVLHMPRDTLRRRLGPIRQLAARPLAGDGPSYGMAGAYLRGLARAIEKLDGGAVEGLGRIAIDLVALAMGEQQTPEARRPAESVRAQADHVIRLRFREPDLATPEIARAVGVSVRRLQEVFALEGATPMEALWRARLDAADAALRDPAARALSITEIAYRCGFDDSAQFSRRFRARFGASPRDVRRGSV